MEKPEKPWPPWEWNFKAKIEEHTIYSQTVSTRDDRYEDEDDDEDEDNEKKKGSSFLSLNKMNLEKLLSLIPPHLGPKDIKIKFIDDRSGMGMSYYGVRFYYETKIPANKAGFKLAQKEYKEKLKQYEKDVVEYEKWEKEQEVLKLKERLKELGE